MGNDNGKIQALNRHYAERAEAFASEAGGLLLRELEGERDISFKTRIDLVTEMDRASEQLIISRINSEFPDDRILSEEAGEAGGDGDRRWIVDPLDGTTNYAHGFPFFAVSIAVEDPSVGIVAAAVCAPYMNEMYTAFRGGGARLNGRSVSVSDTKELKYSLLATGFPYDVVESGRNIGCFTKFLYIAQEIRRPGSAALDLCSVAAGRLDGFWEFGLKSWDTAAGLLIVSEAGGAVTAIDGGAYNPFIDGILATNGRVHSEMKAVLNE